jgi:LmbE family N-acetylglucosaminyl deacetylase
VTDAFTIPKRAMAIFAHPDDVDFGCSGTLASWIRAAGTHVTYCVITSGQKGTHDPKMTPELMAETRQREQRAAGEAIGVEDFVFLGRQDGELEATMELRGAVCRVIREHRPEVVFTNDPWAHYQVHPDHRVAGWSGLDGVIAARDHLFFPEQLRGGKLKKHRVSRVFLFGTREPNLWFDISGTLAKKLAALKSHASQVGRHKGFDERMRAWSTATGSVWDVGPAEAFRYLELG